MCIRDRPIDADGRVLDHETCLALNPRLVYCSVAAYSREGAFADRFGFDPIAQAESGFV